MQGAELGTAVGGAHLAQLLLLFVELLLIALLVLFLVVLVLLHHLLHRFLDLGPPLEQLLELCLAQHLQRDTHDEH